MSDNFNDLKMNLEKAFGWKFGERISGCSAWPIDFGKPFEDFDINKFYEIVEQTHVWSSESGWQRKSVVLGNYASKEYHLIDKDDEDSFLGICVDTDDFTIGQLDVA